MEDADNILSYALLCTEAIVINEKKLFRKILSSKTPNMEPCDTPKVTIDIIDAYWLLTSF